MAASDKQVEAPKVTLQLSAITYNIHAFIGQFWTSNKKEKRIAELIQNDGTGKPYDIVALDEAWDPSASKLIQQRAGYQHGIHTEKLSPNKMSVYGDGLATLTNWKILQHGRVVWKHHNWSAWEGKVGAWKGFSYAKLQHPSYPKAQIVVYNLHGLNSGRGTYVQKMVYENFEQLGEHIATFAANDAVLVGGDFNWRHRWRPVDARSAEGPICPDFGKEFVGQPRCDCFGVLIERGGVTDSEFAVKGMYDWSTAVDRWFFKSGRDVEIKITKWNYLGKETPYHGLSDHHPQEIHFDMTFEDS